MTKEQIERHGKVIKWFIDNPDKGVWYRRDDIGKWLLEHEPNFLITTEYIQNDKYVEFRKALADGKTIQFSAFSKVWEDLDNPEFTENYNYYRIKPKLKFKKGDWIVQLNREINEPICRITQVDDNGQIHYDNKGICSPDSIELWRPKQGELIVFIDNEKENYFIRRCKEEDKWDDSMAPLEFIQILKNK